MQSLSEHNTSTGDTHDTYDRFQTVQCSFDQLGILDNAPHNPRDHFILEAIWYGMLEWRFVNLAPYSLLPTCLEYHFQGGLTTAAHLVY